MSTMLGGETASAPPPPPYFEGEGNVSDCLEGFSACQDPMLSASDCLEGFSACQDPMLSANVIEVEGACLEGFSACQDPMLSASVIEVEGAGNRTTASAPTSYYDVGGSSARVSTSAYHDYNSPFEEKSHADAGNKNPNVNIKNNSQDKQVKLNRANFINMDTTWQVRTDEGLSTRPRWTERLHVNWIITIGSVLFFVLLVLQSVGILELLELEGGWGFAIISLNFVFVFILPFDAWAATSYRYLKQIHDKGAVERIVNRMKRSRPSVQWDVQCYHFETREIRNEDGTYERHKERVYTWNANENFKFDFWNDVSAPLEGMDQSLLTQLQLQKKFVFDNRKTAAEFRRQKNSFKATNKKDMHQQFSQKLIVPCFESNILCEAYKGAKPCCLNRAFYWLFHLICLGPCYRMWFDSICGKKRHEIKKVLSCN